MIYDLTFAQWQDWVEAQSLPNFRAEQIFNWLYVKRVTSFEEMTNLPKTLRAELAEHFRFDPLEEITRFESKDGTIKCLFKLADGQAIETVLMNHNYGYSICVTTQVGCRIGCTFCASTLGGLKRNLSAGEIVAQVVAAQKILDAEDKRISSIVVMGIGEPFDNYDALIDFLHIVSAGEGLRIGQRHITVSTSGIIPGIIQFAEENLQVNLAISLHAPNQELRSSLMPINRKYPLAELMGACHYYLQKTGRRLTIEYALIGGKNDQVEHAEQLANLLQGMLCFVNLIPVNHVPERKYTRTSRSDIFRFQRTLTKHRIEATIRREQGHDIEAACGQLRAKHAGLS